MKYLFDTNALSEPTKVSPDARFMEWLSSVDGSDVSTSVIVMGELQKGLELAQGKKQASIKTFIDDTRLALGNSILPITDDTAILWGRFVAQLQTKGRPTPAIDSLIATQAIEHNLVLVTRNVPDFKSFTDLGLIILSPWS